MVFWGKINLSSADLAGCTVEVGFGRAAFVNEDEGDISKGDMVARIEDAFIHPLVVDEGAAGRTQVV